MPMWPCYQYYSLQLWHNSRDSKHMHSWTKVQYPTSLTWEPWDELFRLICHTTLTDCAFKNEISTPWSRDLIEATVKLHFSHSSSGFCDNLVVFRRNSVWDLSLCCATNKISGVTQWLSIKISSGCGLEARPWYKTEIWHAPSF
jgi:hypothetical protein